MESGQRSFHAATAGILILATITALCFWFLAMIGLAGWLNPPTTTSELFGTEMRGDYFSSGRIWFALVGSLVMTVLTWIAADYMAD